MDQSLKEGLLWPEPLLRLNPSFEPGSWIHEPVKEGILHQECLKIFRKGKTESSEGDRLHLHKHQEDAIRIAPLGHNYVLTTGTGDF